jgi:hypothetical protein
MRGSDWLTQEATKSVALCGGDIGLRSRAWGRQNARDGICALGARCLPHNAWQRLADAGSHQQRHTIIAFLFFISVLLMALPTLYGWDELYEVGVFLRCWQFVVCALACAWVTTNYANETLNGVPLEKNQ